MHAKYEINCSIYLKINISAALYNVYLLKVDITPSALPKMNKIFIISIMNTSRL